MLYHKSLQTPSWTRFNNPFSVRPSSAPIYSHHRTGETSLSVENCYHIYEILTGTPSCKKKKRMTQWGEAGWNWEGLVRLLASEDLYRHPESVRHMPPGLRRRRRIWKLAEHDMIMLEEERIFYKLKDKPERKG